MPKDYVEWRKNVDFQDDPDLHVLHTFYDVVKQYQECPKSKAAEVVLTIALECVGLYIEEKEKENEDF